MEKEVKGKGKGAFLIFVIIAFLLVNLVLVAASADVAYLYKRSNNIDDNILEVFNKSGLTVETVSDTQIPTKLSAANLNNYKMIFVGDERFRNVNNIPVDKKPTIIANYYFGEEWGLTDYDGVSKLGSNSPLNVRLVDNGIRQVYTQAKYTLGGSAIPYYYLGDENKATGFESIARTYLGANGNNEFGDVISYAQAGTHLINGKTALGKICFFGIIESDFWTSQAEDMFEDCLGFVAMECASNADCPSQETGPRYCQNNDVYQNIEQFHCENPGRVNSQCVDDLIPQKIEECDDGDAYTEDTCSNGACQHNPLECIQASDCGEDDWINEPLCVGNNVHQDYQTFSCINNICSNQTNQILNETCSEGCFNGACAEITCSSNIECGSDGYIGDEFCQGDDVYRNYQDFLCNNPGTINSSCSSNSTPQLVEQCSGTCQAGNCVDIACSTDADCDDQDAGTEDNCNLPGTPASYCTNEPIVCFRNSDCGINGYTGASYCISDDVFRNFQSHICFNAETASSYCASNVTQILNTICPDTCYLGSCVDITCYNNADCDDGSAYTEDICLLPGTILSSCTHGDITCIQDSDCGADMFIGDTYCTGNDVFRDFKAYDCKNEGTTSSYCSSNITGNFLENCAYVCANGDCIRCNDNPDCDDQDSSTYDICRFSGTPESYCGHEHIECSTDEECGIDGFVGLPFCQGDDLYQDYREFDCKNEGTPGSYCDDGSAPQLIEECPFSCAGSECLPGIHDVALIDFTNSFGGIFLEVNGTDILDETPILNCNDVIKAKVRVENQGDFTENVSLTGNLNGLIFSLNPVNGMTPTQTAYRTSLSPYISLASLEGLYNIIVNAIIPQDDDLSDNQATRQVEIICPDCFTDSDCPDDINGSNYCVDDDVYHDITEFECVGGDCLHNTNPELVEECAFECVGGECQDCTPLSKIEDFAQLRQEHGLGDINLGDGYVLFKGPAHDDLKVVLQKHEGGSQIIYCHDLFGECPSGCQDNDDLCIFNRQGTLLHTDNFLTGDIPYIKVDVEDGDVLKFGIGEDSQWNVGLEIWEGTCPQEPECEPEGYYGQYYNHVPDGVEFENSITGYVPGDNPFNHPNWWNPAKLSFTRVDSSLDFGNNFWPVDDGLTGDPQHFTVHWQAVLTAAEGNYDYRLKSDDDSWLYINGVLVEDIGGVHGATTHTGSAHLNAGINTFDLYFAERHTSQSELSFRWLEPGIEINSPIPVCSV